ncbi:hypothetical protein SBRCBS47491_010172 [Sporothrix bragantina]|uniref:5-oxoprolinase (ATP-hydrolysing) n=1 Tax=Sporothrix bragantina TaxID=671064 RepID=A0ABP0D403_9PEZI
MQSNGGLVDFKRLSGLRSILSGLAGGLVGYAKTTYDPKDSIPVIGFDMGGTSTDVRLYTIAAGGGSILAWKNGLFTVGPDSAGAHPGPACYRKGGPLTVTDANLFLGRLLADYFPHIFGPSEDMPLDTEIVASKFQEMTDIINKDAGSRLTPEEVAIGFLNVANEAMCRPIRSLTEGKGYDVRNHRLAAFGGAGGQHACSIADILGIEQVVIHKYSSILSAYGMALADVVDEALEPSSEVLSADAMPRLAKRIEALEAKTREQIVSQGLPAETIRYERYLNLRYDGTSTALMIMEPANGDYTTAFTDRYLQEFSFNMPGRPIIVDDIRVRGIAFEPVITEDNGISEQLAEADKQLVPVQASAACSTASIYFEKCGRIQAPVYNLDDLSLHQIVTGPAIILDKTQTILVIPGSTATVLDKKLVLRIQADSAKLPTKSLEVGTIDPIVLSIFAHRFMSIAEQMGLTLQKTSMSLNIRERLDFSCAIFGADGGLVANAPHVPVHLGSMQHAVQYQHNLHLGKLRPGDVLLTNSPAAGGTHLPDLTVVSPIFDSKGENILFYTAARGHHRDIGGKGGMSGHPMCTYLEEEGAVIKSFKLVSEGIFDEEGVRYIFITKPAEYPGCTGSNSIEENISDLKAQIAANQRGSNLIRDLFEEYGTEAVQTYMAAIQKNAELAVRQHLMKIAQKFPEPLSAFDTTEDGSEIHLKITIDPKTGSADFDFTGTMAEAYYSNNGTPSIVRSAIIYVLRCIINDDIPLNQGCLAPINIIVPEGTVISPSEGAAVYGCNSMIANRITDVILKAFRHCAASQGTMNGLQLYGGELYGADGSFNGYSYMYGETICGGSGAGPTWNGASGVHTHMTNTRAMDPEVLEKRIPLLIRQFSLRPGSGGKGLHRGGDGAIRIFEARAPMTFILDNERRVSRPYGLAGGEPGRAGLNMVVLHQPNGRKRTVNVGPKAVLNLKPGEQLQIHTPGGGGWGEENMQEEAEIKETASSVAFQRAAGSLSEYMTRQAEN